MVLDGRNLTQMQYLVPLEGSDGPRGAQVAVTCSTADHPRLQPVTDGLVAALDLEEVLR